MPTKLHPIAIRFMKSAALLTLSLLVAAPLVAQAPPPPPPPPATTPPPPTAPPPPSSTTDATSSNPSAADTCTTVDCRDTFEASFFVGLAIDTFAAADQRQYVNPDAASQIETEDIAGFDFAYRLVGDPAKNSARQLWLYGETVHGMRSAEVNCTDNPDLLSCSDAVPTDPSKDLIFILRNASSLEAFAGLRYELFTIHSESSSPANFYTTAEIGFVTAEGQGDDLLKWNQIAAGLTIINGNFEGSYLQFGYGDDDLLQDDGLYTIDAFLSWPLTKYEGVRGFAEITIDTDFGPGSDNVISYIGFDFSMKCFFKNCSSN